MFEERKGTLVRVHKMPEDLLRCEFVLGPEAKLFGNTRSLCLCLAKTSYTRKMNDLAQS